MAERLFAVVEALALALWIGALSAFAFVFAPTAFHIVSDLEVFATLMATVIGKLNALGFACGGIALLAVIARNREDAALGRLTAVRATLIVVMLGLVFVEGHFVVPAMQALRIASDPYDRLHQVSSLVYGLVLILGYTAIALAVLALPEAMRRRTLG